MHYYRHDLAVIHDQGFSFHADRCAPGILELLAPVRDRLPDEPLPAADAIVSVGHVISYLPDAAAIDRAVVAMAGALRPGGVLAFDILDLAYGEIPPGRESSGRVAEDWAIVARYEAPAPDLYVREITTFVPDGHGAWRRDDERHENVLVDTSRLPGLLAEHGVDASVRPSFGTELLPPGPHVVAGSKRPA